MNNQLLIHGTVVIRHGVNVEISDQQGQRYYCSLRRSMQQLVVGDQVICQLDQDGNRGVINQQLPRQSTLIRQNRQGEKKTIAANIDRLLIVIAAEPNYQSILIDQYLVAAELLNIKPVLIFNKQDLLSPSALAQVKLSLSTYQAIDIDVIYISCQQQLGLSSLNRHLQQHRCVLVGQSGVGKSSIIATLLPQQTIKIGKISEQGQGRHTTSQSQLYFLENGSELIDSPGIREFGLWPISIKELADGFRELKNYQKSCQFNNCRHQQEPGCAVKQAVKHGKISPQRLQNFHQSMLNCQNNEYQ